MIFVSNSAMEANTLIKRMPHFHFGVLQHRMAMLAELGILKLERLRLVVLDVKLNPKQK